VKFLIMGAVALALGVGLVSTAVAAPSTNNPNIQTIAVDCGELGAFDVHTTEHGVTAFGPEGVLVAKKFTGDVAFTVTTNDNAVFGPFFDSEESGGQGRGYQERLVPCEFVQEFTDSFILDEGAADFFDIPASYIGTEVTTNGTFEGTAWVIVPGKH